jgi:hypothetical protein
MSFRSLASISWWCSRAPIRRACMGISMPATGIARYGEVAEIQNGFLQFMQGMFGGVDAPNPHEVAEEIAKLAITPAGQRPERVVIGNSFGADAVNAAERRGRRPRYVGLGKAESHLSRLRSNPRLRRNPACRAMNIRRPVGVLSRDDHEQAVIHSSLTLWRGIEVDQGRRRLSRSVASGKSDDRSRHTSVVEGKSPPVR